MKLHETRALICFNISRCERLSTALNIHRAGTGLLALSAHCHLPWVLVGLSSPIYIPTIYKEANQGYSQDISSLPDLTPSPGSENPFKSSCLKTTLPSYPDACIQLTNLPANPNLILLRGSLFVVMGKVIQTTGNLENHLTIWSALGRMDSQRLALNIPIFLFVISGPRLWCCCL